MRTRGEGVKNPKDFADVLYVWPFILADFFQGLQNSLNGLKSPLLLYYPPHFSILSLEGQEHRISPGMQNSSFVSAMCEDLTPSLALRSDPPIRVSVQRASRPSFVLYGRRLEHLCLRSHEAAGNLSGSRRHCSNPLKKTCNEGKYP